MECKICFEQFDSNSFTPKILIKCGHSFCKICTEKISSKSLNIICPICRETTKYSNGKDIPTNYSLIEYIDQIKETKESRNILEKFKFFNDKNYKHITEKIIRNSEPKILNLKKIVNDDFVYLEEIKNNQNYSIFSNTPRRNNRYNFNRNSIFGYFFNEYSNNLIMFRKACKCQHKFSCMEHLLNKLFKYSIISLAIKIPLKFIFHNYFYIKKSEAERKNFIFTIQIFIFLLNGVKEVYKCFRNFQIDEYIKK
jgi:hypothetical protein